MTLTTKIRLYQQMDAELLRAEATAIVGGTFEEVGAFGMLGGSEYRMVMNAPGQDLLAMVVVLDLGAGSAGWTRACAEVWFDTPCRWVGADGATCNDLHAFLVERMLARLRTLGVPATAIRWQNEYTGRWHRPSEPTSRLGDAEKGRLAARAAMDLDLPEGRPED